jgi:predicted nucleic acid-binding protein
MDKSTHSAGSMVLTEAEAIELFAFFISAARTQLDDPCQYASMRLLSAAENLRDFIVKRVSSDTRGLLEETLELTAHAQIYMADADDYTDTLDELCRMVARFVVEHSELFGEQS